MSETVTLTDGSCCCGGAPCVCQACFLCKEVHRRGQAYPCAWNYTGAGFTSGDASCAVFNGTFRMTPNGTCSWRYSDASRTVVWIYNVVDVRWELRLTSGATTITYAISGPDWNCCAANAPTLIGEPGAACANYGSVTVAPETPCPCPPDPCACFPCPLCDNRLQQFPCQWRFLGTGFGDDSAVDCTRFNRTLLLSMTASCKWEYDDPTDVHVVLDLSDDVAILSLFSYTPPGNEVFVARYAVNGAAWNCCSNNALPLVLDGNQCGIQGVPATLTLQPVSPCGCGGRTGCLYCVAAPNSWRLVVAGITNGTCSDCNNANGEFTLAFFQPVVCGWQVEPAFTFCGLAQHGTWQLTEASFGAQDVFELSLIKGIADPAVVATYRVNRADWNCLGTNVMPLVSNSNHCNNYPATLTVVPI